MQPSRGTARCHDRVLTPGLPEHIPTAPPAPSLARAGLCMPGQGQGRSCEPASPRADGSQPAAVPLRRTLLSVKPAEPVG